MEIALSQCGPTSDRQLAIIDKNRDLYLTPIKHIGPAERLVKLGKAVLISIVCNIACKQDIHTG